MNNNIMSKILSLDFDDKIVRQNQIKKNKKKEITGNACDNPENIIQGACACDCNCHIEVQYPKFKITLPKDVDERKKNIS